MTLFFSRGQNTRGTANNGAVSNEAEPLPANPKQTKPAARTQAASQTKKPHRRKTEPQQRRSRTNRPNNRPHHKTSQTDMHRNGRTAKEAKPSKTETMTIEAESSQPNRHANHAPNRPPTWQQHIPIYQHAKPTRPYTNLVPIPQHDQPSSQTNNTPNCLNKTLQNYLNKAYSQATQTYTPKPMYNPIPFRPTQQRMDRLTVG